MSKGNHLLPADARFVTEYNTLLDAETKNSKTGKNWEESKFRLELFPEPYIGHPKAPVYILNANPGVPGDIETEIPETFSPAKLNAMQNNLLHQGGGFYYFDKEFKDTGGYKWWSNRIVPAFGGRSDDDWVKKVKATFFCLELIGYHSKFFDRNLFRSAKKKAAGWPPSMEYNKELVIQAMKERKIIFIMKAARFWFDLVPDLRKYSKCDIIGERNSSLMETYVSPWAMQQLNRLLK